LVKGTTTAVAPTDFVSAHMVPHQPGAIINQTLAALWPGLAAQHIYGFSAVGGQVVVSCA